MLLDILLLIIGLTLILFGANYMTDGSAAIAKRMGLSDFIVGLTIVSMMTSAPELVVSIMSAANASSEMAIGNIVGSNIFNILIIVGLVAILRPIKVGHGILVNEIPLVILSSAALLVIGNKPLLDHESMFLSRVDGILLLFFFIIFMRYTITSAKKVPASDITENSSIKTDVPKKSQDPLWKSLLFLTGGLAALICGGEWFVDGASGLAHELGWSEAVIGLTIIAAGTSLPELATSVVAARKGLTGICIGNVIGSCIFNIFFVLGCTATIHPLSFGSIGNLDLITLFVVSVMFWVFGWFYGKRTITRLEGVIMVLVYVAYMFTQYLLLSN